jgi:ABC-type transport system involved in cytochrome c biogenesis permease subunit
MSGDFSNPQAGSLNMARVEWGVILSLLMSALTLAFTFGIIYGQVTRNDARIAKLEAQTGDFASRLERIDANVAFLAERAKEDRENAR